MRILKLLIVTLICSYSVFFVILHMRLQSTILGYEAGKLKSKEAYLIRERSGLMTKLAKVTKKDLLLSRSQEK